MIGNQIYWSSKKHDMFWEYQKRLKRGKIEVLTEVPSYFICRFSSKNLDCHNFYIILHLGGWLRKSDDESFALK